MPSEHPSKMWSGRFREPLNRTFEQWRHSFHCNWRLLIPPVFAVCGISSFLHAQSDKSAEAAPSPTLRSYLLQHLSNSVIGPDKGLNGLIRAVPLRAGHQEWLVYLGSREWCGSGGCTLLLLEQAGSEYKSLGAVTIAQLPIYVLRSTSNGHPDIVVNVHGGGLMRDTEARLTFNGTRYPSNPSMLPLHKVTIHRGSLAVLSSEDKSVSLF